MTQAGGGGLAALSVWAMFDRETLGLLRDWRVATAG